MRALRIYDGPDEVHVHSIARHEFKRQQEREGAPLLRLLCRDLSLQ
jgi:acyl-CoA dehydrogenase